MERSLAWMLAGALLAGCPSDGEGTADVAAVDSTGGDVAVGDSGGPDTADGAVTDGAVTDGAVTDGATTGDGTSDTGGTTDAAPGDGGALDVGPAPDSAAADAAADVSPTDTAAVDTSPQVSCWGGDPVFPTFDKGCGSNAGCAVALHQVDCCGTAVALGIATSEVPAFEAAEALCLSQYPACDCGPVSTTDEAGQVGSAFEATCDAGACTSHVISVPPLGENDLEPWLSAGSYADWTAESAPHASAGPHFGKVRTFVNGPLAASLAAGAQVHPVGSAAVKELYGNGDTVLGWSVMVRASAAAQGQGWYWYEDWQGTIYADDVGASLCTGCHSGGTDYVLTPWPLK
ncbi:MAG: hypothetical protein AMXMBFR64_24940 [Myxococcales bacterium]